MRPAVQRGFTLIEILVAVFVIVMVASVVMLNLNSPARDRMAEQHAQSLSNMLNYALDEAEFSAQAYGLFMWRNLGRDESIDLEFRRLDEGLWRRVEDEVLSAPLVFDSPLELRVHSEGGLVELEAKPEDETQLRPVFWLWPSGEMSVGNIEIRDPVSPSEEDWMVSWTLFGQAQATMGEPE